MDDSELIAMVWYEIDGIGFPLILLIGYVLIRKKRKASDHGR
jgi:hypothetical protein